MKPERIVEGVRLSNPDKVLYPEQAITKRPAVPTERELVRDG